MHDQFQEHRTLVNGHEIAFYDEGTGPPVLLLHGIPTRREMWREVIPRLSNNRRVIAPDLLNFGRSDKPHSADVSINAQQRIMLGLLDALGIARADVVAHDIGGGVAQLMAVNHPERIDRLVLIDSVSFDSWPIEEFKPLQQPGAEQAMGLDEFVAMMRDFMPNGVVDQQAMRSEVIDMYLEPWSSEDGKRAFFRNLRRLNSEYTEAISEQLANLPHQTLVIWGADDPFQKPEYAAKLTAAIPDSKSVLIEDTGHWLIEERPEEVADQIGQFLNGPDRSAR